MWTCYGALPCQSWPCLPGTLSQVGAKPVMLVSVPNSLPDYKFREGLREDDIIVLRTHSLITRTGYSRTTGYTLQNGRPGQGAINPSSAQALSLPSLQILSSFLSVCPSRDASGTWVQQSVTDYSAEVRVFWEDSLHPFLQSPAIGRA